MRLQVAVAASRDDFILICGSRRLQYEYPRAYDRGTCFYSHVALSFRPTNKIIKCWLEMGLVFRNLRQFTCKLATGISLSADWPV
jgi:hypothetical protein